MERMFLAKNRYPFFKDFNSKVFEKNAKLLDSGFCVPLKERNEEGAKIVMIRLNKWNPDEFNAYDVITTFVYIMSILLEEEESQIAGFVTIFDLSDISMKHLLTPGDSLEFFDFLKNCAPVRQKGNFLVNLPQIVNFILQIARSVLSEKLQKRIYIVNKDELKDRINPEILPQEYGGKLTCAEMMTHFRGQMDAFKKYADMFWDFEIDLSKVPADKIYSKDEENTGSFRKLQID